MFIFFSRFEKFSAIISLNQLYAPLSLFLLLYNVYICSCYGVTQVPLDFLLFFILFPFYFSDWMNSTALCPSSLILCPLVLFCCWISLLNVFCSVIVFFTFMTSFWYFNIFSLCWNSCFVYALISWPWWASLQPLFGIISWIILLSPFHEGWFLICLVLSFGTYSPFLHFPWLCVCFWALDKTTTSPGLYRLANQLRLRILVPIKPLCLSKPPSLYIMTVRKLGCAKSYQCPTGIVNTHMSIQAHGGLLIACFINSQM